MPTARCVAPALALAGLTAIDASDLSNYFHFREPVGLGKKSVLERRGLVASTDFLDPISEDTPRYSMMQTVPSVAWCSLLACVAPAGAKARACFLLVTTHPSHA